MNRPLSPEQVVKSLYKISISLDLNEVPEGIKGAMRGIIQNLVGSRQRRQLLFYKIFPGKWATPKDVTTNDLLPGQWAALQRWIEPGKSETPNGKTPWFGSADFVTEVALIMAESKQQEGQEHLDNDGAFLLEYCTGRYGCVPVMVCGCEANQLTALFEPYCSVHCEAGQNKEAYQIKADQSLMELEGEEK